MVGNDIIDLQDPEAQPQAPHPRFDRRVFTDDELQLIKGDRRPNERRWMLWACKESAYKLVKRRNPATVFSPRAFEVGVDCSQTVRVDHRGESVSLVITRHGDAIHAVATWEQQDHLRIISEVGTTVSDPSDAVRRLARQRLARAFRCTPAEIEISSGFDDIPRIRVGGRESVGFLSFSHHGRFVAFAYCPPSRNEGLT